MMKAIRSISWAVPSRCGPNKLWVRMPLFEDGYQGDYIRVMARIFITSTVLKHLKIWIISLIMTLESLVLSI